MANLGSGKWKTHNCQNPNPNKNTTQKALDTAPGLFYPKEGGQNSLQGGQK